MAECKTSFKNNSDVLLLDYDDLSFYANKALDDDEILKYYQNLYDYVLTDESKYFFSTALY